MFTDSYGWPQAGCSFPEWFTRTTWRDLSGRHIYSHDAFGEVMSLTYKRRPDTLGHIRNAYRCLKSTSDRNTAEEIVTILSFTSDDWWVYFHNMSIHLIVYHNWYFVLVYTHNMSIHITL